MSDLTLRAAKGAPLTNNELDANFTALNDGKLEKVSDRANDAEAIGGANLAKWLGPREVALAIAALASGWKTGDLLWTARNPGAGWLNLDTVYAQAAYPALFAVLGTRANGALADGWSIRGPIGATAINTIGVVSDKIAVLGGDGSSLHRTMDGGVTFESLNVFGEMASSLNNLIEIGSTGKVLALGFDVGLTVSNDFGETWDRMASNVFFDGSPSTAIIHMNGDVLIASGSNFVKRSTDGGVNWVAVSAIPTTGNRSRLYKITDQIALVASSNTAVMYRTDDAGVTWTEITIPAGATSLQGGMHIGGGIIVLTGANDTSIRSTDYGLTWAAIASLAGVNARQVLVTANGQLLVTVYGGSRPVYRSLDSGATWANTAAAAGINSWNSVATAEGDTIVMGQDGVGAPRRSTDGGVTFSNVDGGAGAGANAAMLRLSNGVLIALGASGLNFRSTDNGATWVRGWSGGVSTHNVRVIARSQVTGTLFIVTNQNTLWRSKNQGRTWQQLHYRSASAVCVFADGTVLVTSATSSFVSTNDGDTFTAAGLVSFSPTHLVAQDGTTALAFGGASGAYSRTTNKGTSWTALTAGATTHNAATATRISGTVSMVATNATPSTLLRSTNAGASFSSVTYGTTMGISALGRVTDSIVFMSGAAGAVRMSVDGGATWTAMATMPGSTPMSSIEALSSGLVLAGGPSGAVRRNFAATYDSALNFITPSASVTGAGMAGYIKS